MSSVSAPVCWLYPSTDCPLSDATNTVGGGVEVDQVARWVLPLILGNTLPKPPPEHAASTPVTQINNVSNTTDYARARSVLDEAIVLVESDRSLLAPYLRTSA